VPRLDVGIIGAGPAGAWAAWRLAQGGARVRLFDASHPREKPCGGGVTGRALGLVAGALEPERLPALAVEGATFEAGEMSARVPLTAAGLSRRSSLLVVDRSHFDGALLDAALAGGAELVRSHAVDPKTSARGCTIVTRGARHDCDWLIGADGPAGLTRHRLARPFARTQLSIAAGFFVHGRSGHDIVVRFESSPPGYLWSFPRPDHLAVGICAQADATDATGLRQRAAAWIERSGMAAGARLEPYTWPIPSLSSADLQRERPAGPRWLLVGDAAGLVDPLTREGIFFALESADLAAGALLAPDGGGRRVGSPADRYVAALRARVLPELAHAARMKAGFFRPQFADLLVHAVAGSDRVRRVMADLVGGRQPYATLKRRLLATFDVGLAWRLLRLEIRAALEDRREPYPAK
jgi:geranylgeranyl reductase family protein